MSTVRTVTLSPGFDHVVVLDALVPGGTGRVVSWAIEPAGKGVNAARAMRYLDTETVAYALVGEAERASFEAALDADGIRHVTVGVRQRTRNNITLSVQGSDSIAAHAAGSRLSDVPDEAINGLFARLLQDIQPGDVVTFNGSLPTGCQPWIWSRWSQSVRKRGALLIVDTHGPALADVLQAGGIHAAMPNVEEIADLAGLTGIDGSVPPVERALEVLRAHGVDDPLVTLGENGVLHLVNGAPVRSSCQVETARVVVGAGDAFLAGYCAALVGNKWGSQPVLAGLAAAAAHVGGASRDGFAIATRDAMSRTVSARI